MTHKLSFAVLSIVAMMAGALIAEQAAPAASQKLPLAERIAHTVPGKYRASPSVHGGPGQLDYMGLFNATALDTNLYFLHRGMIQPKSGIGAHFHNQCEEMFVIFDGEAQFTIDGRTSVLKGPAGAPVRMGHSHAIYNPTDKPVQWMNINVSARKGMYDAFDLGDARVERRSGSDPDVHDDAPRSGAASARSGSLHDRSQGYRAVPPRASAVGVSRPVGVRRSSRAAARQRDGATGTSGGRRVLLRDEWRRHRQGRRRKRRRFDRATPCPFS